MEELEAEAGAETGAEAGGTGDGGNGWMASISRFRLGLVSGALSPLRHWHWHIWHLDWTGLDWSDLVWSGLAWIMDRSI
jgi:hypothetical protein